MDFGLASYGLGFLAGLLSTLSPCVLPIIPILLGSATHAHARAPLALAAGLALSYAIVGTGLAWAGANLDWDPSNFRNFGAMALGLIGLLLVSGSLQRRFAAATSGVGDAANNMLSRIQMDGLWGQFITGLVLGVVWSPCVGPTLGAAVVIASQGTHLPQVAMLMGLFGMGAALPVVVLAYVSRGAMAKMRGRLMQAGQTGKLMLGGVMIALSALILTGLDKQLEASLVDLSPPWLTRLTTRF